MYVETEFLLALAKRDDWLRPHAEAALDEYDDLETSIVPFVEFLLVADRFEFDRRRAVSNLLELVPIRPESDGQVVLKAAAYADDHDATTFDAFNAAIVESRGGSVLASDRRYDDLDIERVPLESAP